MTYEELESRLKANPESWLVTGVAGFIGSHLLQALLELNQTVVGLDNFSSGSRSNLSAVQANVSCEQWELFSLIEGDLGAPALCQAACQNVNYVLHEAAVCSVPRSIADPLSAHATNVTAFLNLLMAARDWRVKGFVYASSSAVYGDHPGLPKTESQIGNLLSPYGATKYMDELYAGVFGRCYEFQSVGLRYFNVFGPRQDPNGAYAAVIPKWIQALLSGQPVVIHGDGQTSRDFCYVGNVVRANLLAALAGEQARNQVYNVGVGRSTTLNELFAMLKKLLGPTLPTVAASQPVFEAFRAGDIRHSQADITRAEKLLGYSPRFGFEEGLKLTADYYKGLQP